MIFETLTEQRWRHQWQVIRREYTSGTVLVLCSHRSEMGALLHAHGRNVFDRRPVVAYDVRRAPEVVR